jgi:hypothetical protein
MLIVPLLAIQAGLQTLVPTSELHPFIRMIQEHRDPIQLWPIAWAAVVVAPLVEELMFRALLQGWLERAVLHLAVSRPASPASPSYPRPVDEPNSPIKDELAADTTAARTTESTQVNPWLSPAGARQGMRTSRIDPLPLSVDASTVLRNTPWRWLPILVSAAVFAIAHLGHGVAPVSLFFLAIGLGVVYQRTHRLLPCVVVHFLVNLTTVLQLLAWVSTQT